MQLAQKNIIRLKELLIVIIENYSFCTIVNFKFLLRIITFVLPFQHYSKVENGNRFHLFFYCGLTIISLFLMRFYNMKQNSIVKKLFSPVDLTKGKPIKSLLVFMLPILLSLVFQQIYTISDAAIVGQTLSKVEVAGVNDVYGLFYIVIQFSFGCAAGFSVISSEKAGESDEEGIIIPNFLLSPTFAYVPCFRMKTWG